MSILWNILLTTYSSRVWIFFDVWNTIGHAKMPQEIAGYFLADFESWRFFCPLLNFCIFLRASHGKISAHMINCHSFLNYWNDILYFLLLQIVMSGKNWLEVLKFGQKIHKNWKSAKKVPCLFLRRLCMYHGVSYIKKNPNPRRKSG